VTWWWGLVWIAAAVGLNAVLVPRVRRRAVSRGLREGRVPVCARALEGDVPGVSRRWHGARALHRDGRVVLQRATDHETQAGVTVLFVASAERRLGFREGLAVTPDATHAVVATTPAGRVELAGSRTALGWLREQLDPGSRPG
jgi:hypothetical protein